MLTSKMILGAFVVLVVCASMTSGNPAPQENSFPQHLQGSKNSGGAPFPFGQGGPPPNAIPGQGGGFPGSATGSQPSFLGTGTCPNLPVVTDFQTHNYLGRWYEIERFEAPFQTGDCGTADYALLSNGSISVTNTQILPNGTMDQALGVANSGGDPSKGSLTVSFADSRSTPVSTSDGPNYNILATDYVNYAVVHSCSIVAVPGRSLKFELSWILARRPSINPLFVQRLKEWLMNLGLNTAMYTTTNQDDNCRYTAP